MSFVAICDKAGAKLSIEFGGQHSQRPMEIIDVDEFIAVKSHRAKGKRLTTYDVARLTFIEPEEPEEIDMEDADEVDVEDVTSADELVEEDALVEESIDVDELMGDDIKVDPTVDYRSKVEVDDSSFTAAQLDLF